MTGEGWPVVVARPLTGSESVQMQLALDARESVLVVTTADEALSGTRGLLDALAEGRIRIEADS